MESFYGGAFPTATQYQGSAYVLGQKFTPTIDGSITGIQFYRTAAMSMTHTGGLYDSFGNLLAQVSFMNVSTGWLEASFSNPVSVNANTPYTVVMVFADGVYLQQDGFNGLSNNDLVIPANSAVWMAGASLAFPVGGNGNYGFAIDVMFQPGTPPPSPIPPASSASVQSRAYNTLDSGTIAAVGACISRAMANGAFSATLWYLWSESQVQDVMNALTTFGYAASYTLWSDGTYEVTIRWPN